MTRAQAVKRIIAAQVKGGVPEQIPATAQALRAAYDLGLAEGMHPRSWLGGANPPAITERALRAIRRMEEGR